MSCFSKNILDYFYNIQNTGRILKPEAIGRAGTKADGTVIEFSWRVKDSIIEDARFRTFGDVNAIAISSIVTTMMTGKSVDEVLSIRPEDILEQLRETKPNYLYLIDLSLSALENTYNNFIKKNNKQERKSPSQFAQTLRSDLNKIKDGELVANDNLNLGDFDASIDEDEQTYLNNINEYNRYLEEQDTSFESLLQRVETTEQRTVVSDTKVTTVGESRGRGRPRKEKTLEELEAEKNKVSRGRGRPKKERTPEELEKLNAPKGKRGRPRKERSEEELIALESKISRGRGRPRKERSPEELLELANKVSRGRGRPRKVEAEANDQPAIQSTSTQPSANSYFSMFNNGFVNKIERNDEDNKSYTGNSFYHNSIEEDIYDDEFEDEIDEFNEIEDQDIEENEYSVEDIQDKNEEIYTSYLNTINANNVQTQMSQSKGRGRPRKERTPEELAKLNAPKGKRGRPKKERSEEEQLALANKVSRGRGRPKKERTEEELAELENKVSRGRGRPKKERTPEELERLNAPKGKRGRPRKTDDEKFVNTYGNEAIQGDDFVLPKKQVINQSTLDFILNNNTIEDVYDQDQEIEDGVEENYETDSQHFEEQDVHDETYSYENKIVETNVEIKKGRGRPRKERTPEELLELENKVSRGRGRPKKEKTLEELEAESNKISRGRGRPRKEVVADENIVATETRGRGRPKKERTPEELAKLNAPKGKRGRPKKETAFVIQNVKPISHLETHREERLVEVEDIEQPVVEIKSEPEIEVESSIRVETSDDNGFSEISINKQVVKEENEYIVPTTPSNSPFAPAQNKYGVGMNSMYKPTITKTITKTTTTNYTFNEKTVTTTTTNQQEENKDDEIEVEKVENQKIDKPKTEKPKNDNTKSLKELMEEDDEEPTNITPLSDNINNILSRGGSIQDALKALLEDK